MISGNGRSLVGALALTIPMLMVAFAPGVSRAQQDRHSVGKPVPVFTLKTVNPDDSGEAYVSVDRYYGSEAKEPKKAILMSFFASWCEPCKREMPFLAAMHETYSDRGLQVLLITIDKEEEKINVAKALAEEADIKFPVLSDRFNIVAKRYYIEKLPNVYILNSEGRVSLVKVGYTDDVTKLILNDVRKNIGEPLGAPIPEALSEWVGGPKAKPATDPVAANTSDPEKGSEGGNDAASGDQSKAKTKASKSKKKKRRRRRKRRK